jgi:hypothetical protein
VSITPAEARRDTSSAVCSPERGAIAGDPETGQIDTIIDGWVCGSAAGGSSCAKLGPHGTIRPINPRHLGPIIDAEGV